MQYRAAFWGAYSDLSQHWNWEESDPNRRLEITASWNEAIFNTLECLQMACLEQLLECCHDQLDAIRDLATAVNSADSPFTNDPATIPLIVDYGVGTPPDMGGITPADWDDYDDLLCGASHAYADLLVTMALDAQNLLDVGTVFIGAIAGIIALMSGAGIILAVGAGFAAELFSTFVALAGTTILGQAASDLDTNRDDIICAVVNGAPLAPVIEGIVGAAAWEGLFRWVDYSSAVNTIHNGDFDMSVERGLDCSCVSPPVGLGFTFWTAGLSAARLRDFTTGVQLNGTEVYSNTVYKVRGDTAGRVTLAFRSGTTAIEAVVDIMTLNRGNAGDSCSSNVTLSDDMGTTILTVTPANQEAMSGNEYQFHRGNFVCMGAWNETSDHGYLEFTVSAAP